MISCRSVLSMDFFRKNSHLLLAFFWVLGIVAGICFAGDMDPVLQELLPQAVASQPQLWGIVWSAAAPFLLTFFAIYISEPLLLLVCFFKAFSFGFCSHGIRLCYGESSWLVQLLFLFSDYILIPCLYFLWLRLLSRSGSHRRELVLFFLMAIAVALVNFRLIAPFLTKLV